jgi:hypothetical protein
MHARITLLAAVLLAGAGPAQAGDNPPKTDDVRKAVERSLPFLEEKGVAWMRERGCVTCHQTAFLIWTHGEAQRRGFPVDRRKLNEWTNWALLQVIALSDSPDGDNGADTLSQILLGRDPASPWFDKPSRWYGRTVDPYENVLKHLLRAQTPDGRWIAGGQSGNPDEIPTAWALLALASRDEFMNATGPGTDTRRTVQAALKRLVDPNNEALPKARDKALAWLQSTEPGKADDLNERLVLRLLIARKFGKPKEADDRLKELLARQNADGGWSADPKLRQPSDAFATGQSLYALGLAGNGDEAAAVERAGKFLVAAQQPNGSWLVPSTAFHPSSGRPERDKKTDEVYTYWGTAWATLGLLHTLPVPAKDAPAKAK